MSAHTFVMSYIPTLMFYRDCDPPEPKWLRHDDGALYRISNAGGAFEGMVGKVTKGGNEMTLCTVYLLEARFACTALAHDTPKNRCDAIRQCRTGESYACVYTYDDNNNIITEKCLGIEKHRFSVALELQEQLVSISIYILCHYPLTLNHQTTL